MSAARLNLFQLAPVHLKAMIHLTQTCKNSSFGRRLVDLILLRVSQINGCGVCVDVHWRDLIKQGADPRHVNAIAGWREAPFFDARERAALAWAEAVNALPHRDDTDALYPQLREHFSEQEIAEMSYTIALIRGWNAINQSLRNQIPVNLPPSM
ncbi:alkylhydroperoxidase AhpD family core domain-containing protein [Cupriavidus sp. YR651]|uniref:carboxymuconolactone decarboxylase family protein n=1 Tax=Cupriavidus sp. YR651 TaxID=1855315 RepID=UPI000882C016|nr:carboxymuconolactone decarboxylase family protein [Cupriavidus sp. YR651]SDC55011.1 alkylhydroperoxidase AhpD family core domain-containing protein [Cupriavidus sp. YR651]